MAGEKLNQSEIKNWYNAFNRVINNYSGGKISALTAPAQGSKAYPSAINDLSNVIVKFKADEYLSTQSSLYTSAYAIKSGEIITRATHGTPLSNTATNLSLINCRNKIGYSSGTCSSGTNGSGTCSSGTCQDGTCQDGTCQDGACGNVTRSVACSHGSYSSGTYSNGGKSSGSKSNWYYSNGTCLWGTHGSGTNSSGTYSEGTNTKGTCKQGTCNQGTCQDGTNSSGTIIDILNAKTS